MKISDATSLKMGTTDIVKVYAGQDVVWEQKPDIDTNPIGNCDVLLENNAAMDAFSFNGPTEETSCLGTSSYQDLGFPYMQYPDSGAGNNTVCLLMNSAATFKFNVNEEPDQDKVESWSYRFKKGQNLWNFVDPSQDVPKYMSVFWESTGVTNQYRLAVRTWADRTPPGIDQPLSEQFCSPTTYIGSADDQWNYFVVIGKANDPNFTFLVAPPSESGAEVRTLTVPTIVDPLSPTGNLDFCGINGTYPFQYGWTPGTEMYLADFCWYNQLDGPI